MEGWKGISAFKMSTKFHFAIKRNVVSILIVGVLCFFYQYYTGRWFVWFFLPISMIPLLITLIESKSDKQEDLQIKKNESVSKESTSK